MKFYLSHFVLLLFALFGQYCQAGTSSVQSHGSRLPKDFQPILPKGIYKKDVDETVYKDKQQERTELMEWVEMAKTRLDELQESEPKLLFHPDDKGPFSKENTEDKEDKDAGSGYVCKLPNSFRVIWYPGYPRSVVMHWDVIEMSQVLNEMFPERQVSKKSGSSSKKMWKKCKHAFCMNKKPSLGSHVQGFEVTLVAYSHWNHEWRLMDKFSIYVDDAAIKMQKNGKKIARTLVPLDWKNEISLSEYRLWGLRLKYNDQFLMHVQFRAIDIDFDEHLRR